MSSAMPDRLVTLATGAALALASAATAAPPDLPSDVVTSPDTAALQSILGRYQTALNSADVDGVLALYADDGVFMAQHSEPAVGRDAVAGAYRGVFGAISLDVTFTVDELVIASPTLAYARTRSAGTTTILANQAKVLEGNQELFLFTRADPQKDWKIGRYLFATTTPRSAP